MNIKLNSSSYFLYMDYSSFFLSRNEIGIIACSEQKVQQRPFICLRISKPGGRLTLCQGHELSDRTSFTERNEGGASRTREDKNETILRLRMETCFAVSQVVVPDSHKNVIKSELPDKRFIGIESAAPLGESLSVV